MFFNVIATIYIAKVLPKANTEVEMRTKRFIFNLTLYPVFMVICWTGAVVNRLQNAIHPNDPKLGLFIWEYGLNATQGMWNALIFALAIRQRRIETHQSSINTITEYTYLKAYHYENDD
jgi:hypothetical protein